MIFLTVKGKTRLFLLSIIVLLCIEPCANAYNSYTVVDLQQSSRRADLQLLKHERVRRADHAPLLAGPPAPASNPAPAPAPTAEHDHNATTNLTADARGVATIPPPSVTRIPLLGVNGSGTLKLNLTDQPKVSEPILDDDNLTEMFKESPEQIQAQHNTTSLKYDHHNFYNSTFIGNVSYFEEHWRNITSGKAEVHPILSDSHRRATTLNIPFAFPFYGHELHNVTVATGGFIYTGEHVHNWLAATQYIAPLMANFDTTATNDSQVKIYKDDEKFTALWENVTLQEDKKKPFTFAVTLYSNGDIVFGYKQVPIPVQDINEYEHPVKVGISDAYQTDRILFYVRRKTIYEYHRVSFKDHEISNRTLLKLVALPTCLQYNTCADCVNHDTGFNCTWCDQIQRCSSGTDRNKQDWLLRNCDKTMISNASRCPATGARAPPAAGPGASTSYITDGGGRRTFTDVITSDPALSGRAAQSPAASAAAASSVMTAGAGGGAGGRSAVGGVVAALLVVAMVSALAGWIVYAFKNPHTRSGQMLIKYRPSQWSWKRGEARYTAATIHM